MSPPRRGLHRPAPLQRAIVQMQEALVHRLGGRARALTEQTTQDVVLEDRATPAGVDFTEPGSAEPQRLGRFEVVERLGAGAMGVVYAAIDPTLQRRVAVKLLQPGRASAQAMSRVYREAQALARLSHPNVVQIYGLGRHAQGVYLAMELVEGSTLGLWQSEGARDWAEILEAYRQAGQGLAAIHRAGLVHRDFKPANVMRDSTGRVRVLDLGLVRGLMTEEPPGISADGLSGPTSISGSATESDAILGTPAYMAPEQFLGEPATAASDQFSYCVALFEALYGCRPFRASSSMELLEAISEHRIEPPPTDSRVPSRIHAAIRRGLAQDVQRRHPSMDALLAALEESSRWRRWGIWGAGALLGVGLVVPSLGSSQSPPCVDAQHVDQVWSATSRAAVSSGLGQPPGAWELMEKLDRHATALRRQAAAACGSGAPSGTGHACRAAALQRFAAVTEVLKTDDDQVRASAAKIIDSLPNVVPCGSGDEHGRRAPPDPASAVAAASAARLGQRAKALGLSSRLDLAQQVADEAMAEAQRSGHAPAIGDALQARGNVFIRVGNYAAAQDDFAGAYDLMLGARDDGGAARAAIALTWLGLRTGDIEGADRWVRLADSAAQAAAGDDVDLNARVQQRLGQVAGARGQTEAAAGHLQRSLAMWESIGEAREIATLCADLMPIAMARGDLDAAQVHAERSIEVLEAAFGAEDAQLGTAYNNLGNVHQRKGQTELSLASHRKALQLREASYGGQHPDVAISAYSVATDLYDLQRDEEALVLLDRVRQILPVSHPAVAAADMVRSGIAARNERPDDAVRLLNRALVAMEARVGPDDPQVAGIRINKSQMLRGLDKPAEALAEAERALASLERSYGDEHPMVGEALAAVARSLVASERAPEAMPLFRRAISIATLAQGPKTATVGKLHLDRGRQQAAAGDWAGARDSALAALQSGFDDASRASTKFLLARALAELGEGRARVAELLAAAEASWSESEDTEALAKLGAWRRRHGLGK